MNIKYEALNFVSIKEITKKVPHKFNLKKFLNHIFIF